MVHNTGRKRKKIIHEQDESVNHEHQQGEPRNDHQFSTCRSELPLLLQRTPSADRSLAAHDKPTLDNCEDVELLVEVLEELAKELDNIKLLVFNTNRGGGGSCAPHDGRWAHVYIRGFTELITQVLRHNMYVHHTKTLTCPSS